MAKMVLREVVAILPTPQVVPIGQSLILHAKQGRRAKSTIDIWFEVDPDTRNVDEAERHVIVLGTGQRVASSYSHLKSVVCENGFVWHIYVMGDVKDGVVV